MKTPSLLCRARSLAERLGDGLLRILRSLVALDAVRALACGKSPLSSLALAGAVDNLGGGDAGGFDTGGTIATLPRGPKPLGPLRHRRALRLVPLLEGPSGGRSQLARKWAYCIARGRYATATAPSPLCYL